MSDGTWEAVLFAAALLCTAGFAWYYVAAVLAEDRPLARMAAVGFFVLCAATVVSLLKIIT